MTRFASNTVLPRARNSPIDCGALPPCYTSGTRSGFGNNPIPLRLFKLAWLTTPRTSISSNNPGTSTPTRLG